MRVVVAPDKFAGTLSAAEAARAMAEGWARSRPDDEVLQIPMADGGEGTLDVVAEATGAERVVVEAANARGYAASASWLRLPDGRALVEAAQAVGLSSLPPDARDPLTATSYGVGQLLRAALDAGSAGVLVTLGGSATVDGGAGSAIALGHRLLRADGNGVKVGAIHLDQLTRVEARPPPAAPVVVATDVENPLLGPDGAAAVFGPQKGARREDVDRLEGLLRHFAGIVERDVPGGPWRDQPGAGAAGGLGFALAAFCGAEIANGAAAVAELVGFDARLAGAGAVVTGEGKIDPQTRQGKAPGYVAARARDAGSRVLAVAGVIEEGAAEAFDDAADLGPEGLERAAELVAERTAELAGRAR